MMLFVFKKMAEIFGKKKKGKPVKGNLMVNGLTK
jgi:hypothetical protein